MGTLYLHIGTPKTGTSAIQKFLCKNREIIKEQGFCYPDFGYRYPKIRKQRNAHFMVHRQKCKSLPEEERKKIRQAEDEQFYEGLDKIKELMDIYPNVIMSDENIWNGYIKRKSFWQLLAKALEERDISLKVIVYLRRQDLLVESYWLQRVKGTSWEMDFQEYIASGKYKEFKLNYYKRLQSIANFVGKENIIVRAYERQQWEGREKTLIQDFFHCVGLEMNDKFMDSDMVVNTRLSGSCLEVKRILNQNEYLREEKSWVIRDLKAIQDEMGHSRCKYFTYKEQVAFLKKYEKCNAAVAREYMNREDGILFRDEVPDKGNMVQENYSPEELVLICGKMLEIHNKEVESQLEDMKKSLAYARRPLIKKIAGKIYHIFSTLLSVPCGQHKWKRMDSILG